MRKTTNPTKVEQIIH